MRDIIDSILHTIENFREENGLRLHYIDENEIFIYKTGKPRQDTEKTNEYNKQWSKLSNTAQTNRLMLYSNKLASDYNLSTPQQIKLKQLFIDVIKGNNAVDYDENEGVVLKIKDLQRSPDTGEFYIVSEKAKPSTKIKMTPVSFDKLVQANSTVQEPVKKKILVKIKKTPNAQP